MDDIKLIDEEEFDFDLPASPPETGMRDDADVEEDEIFFGPVGHIEKCVATAVKEVIEESEVQPLSPLNPAQVALLFKEAQTVAFHISRQKEQMDSPSDKAAKALALQLPEFESDGETDKPETKLNSTFEVDKETIEPQDDHEEDTKKLPTPSTAVKTDAAALKLPTAGGLFPSKLGRPRSKLCRSQSLKHKASDMLPRVGKTAKKDPCVDNQKQIPSNCLSSSTQSAHGGPMRARHSLSGVKSNTGCPLSAKQLAPTSRLRPPVHKRTGSANSVSSNESNISNSSSGSQKQRETKATIPVPKSGLVKRSASFSARCSASGPKSGSTGLARSTSHVGSSKPCGPQTGGTARGSVTPSNVTTPSGAGSVANKLVRPGQLGLKAPLIKGSRVGKGGTASTNTGKSQVPASPVQAKQAVSTSAQNKPAVKAPVSSKLQLLKPGGLSRNKFAKPGEGASQTKPQGPMKATAPVSSQKKQEEASTLSQDAANLSGKIKPVAQKSLLCSTPVKSQKNVQPKRLMSDASTPRKNSESCSDSSVFGTPASTAKRRSFLPTPTKKRSEPSSSMSSLPSLGSSIRSSGSSVSSMGSLQDSPALRSSKVSASPLCPVDVLIDLNPNSPSCASITKGRKPRVMHTPMNKENETQPQRSIWSPVQRPKAISKEEEFIMCTKRTARP